MRDPQEPEYAAVVVSGMAEFDPAIMATAGDMVALERLAADREPLDCECCIYEDSNPEHHHDSYCYPIGSIEFYLEALHERNAYLIKEGRLAMQSQNRINVVTWGYWMEDAAYEKSQTYGKATIDLMATFDPTLGYFTNG